jgi:peptide/nickel transport system permease protein
MLSYILRRIWQMLPTLLGVILLIFFLFKLFGGDPVEIMAGMKASPERLASLRAQLGLDKSVLEQLWVFVQQVFTFNWGKSWTTNEAISDIFATRLPATLTIMIPILMLEVVLAIGAGLAVAYVRGSLTDRAIMIITTVALSISFLVYIIVGPVPVWLCAGLVPGAGMEQQRLEEPRTYAPLPVFLAVLVSLAPQTRLYRSFFLDEIGQDYVRTARAKGVTENAILFKHVLRNAMIPDSDQCGHQLAGRVHRLLPDRSVLLHPRAGARNSGGGESQRLPRHPGGHGVSGSADHGDQPDHRCAVQVC